MSGSTRTWTTATNTEKIMSGSGWILTIIIVIVLYNQFRTIRPIVIGIGVLLLLGMVLKNLKDVRTEFGKIFYTGG